MNEIWETNKRNCDEADRLRKTYNLEALTWFLTEDGFGVSITKNDHAEMNHGSTMEEAVQKAIGEIGNIEVEVKKHEEVEVKGFWRKVKKNFWSVA